MTSTATSPRPAALSIPEAAAQLGISRSHLYGLLDAGVIRSVRLGRRRLIPASEIDRVLEEGAAEAVGR